MEGENITQINTDSNVDSDKSVQPTETPVDGKQDDAGENQGNAKTLLSEGEGEEPDKTLLSDDKQEDKAVEYKDFTLPDGYSFNDEVMAEFKEVAVGSNLSQEDAQKMVDLSVKNVEKAFAEQQNQFLKTRQDWKKEIKEDAEYGGQNFKESITRAKRTLNNFGTPELLGLIDNSGLGDHPEVIKMFVKIDKMLGEDKMAGEDQAPKQDFLKSLYNKSNLN